MSERGRLVLVGGGVRSGKSAFALEEARRASRARGGAAWHFIATAQAYDDEMRARIAAHRAERSLECVTLEEPLAVADAIDRVPEGGIVVLDCLTLWLSNMLLRGDDERAMQGAVDGMADGARRRRLELVVVTNEVGMGVVPESPLGRRFRDVAGRAHQALSRRADVVYMAMMGTVLRLKPAPVEAMLATAQDGPGA